MIRPDFVPGDAGRLSMVRMSSDQLGVGCDEIERAVMRLHHDPFVVDDLQRMNGRRDGRLSRHLAKLAEKMPGGLPGGLPGAPGLPGASLPPKFPGGTLPGLGGRLPGLGGMPGLPPGFDKGFGKKK